MHANFMFCLLAVSLFIFQHSEAGAHKALGVAVVVDIDIWFLESFIPKCKSDDPECMKKSAQVAIPVIAEGVSKYNVPAVDPYKIGFVDASSPNITLFLTDLVITGLKNAVAEEIRRDKEQGKLFIKLLCNVQLEGNYDMKGHLLSVPVSGNGAVHATVRKMLVNIEADLTEFVENRVKHWHAEEIKHSFVFKDKSTVVFENLFPDSKVLGDAAREAISNSGNDVILEVGSPIITRVITAVVFGINELFDNVSASELSMD